MAPPPRPPAPVDARYVDLRATSPDPDSDSDSDSGSNSNSDSGSDSDSVSESSPPDIDLTEPRPVSAHQVELIETGSFTHAACSACGWTGPARRSRAIALADLDRHS